VFFQLAKTLFSKYAIHKKDKVYYIRDIEFYLYDDNHRDIITYPRNCAAGQWFFHSSGVDLSFESYIEIGSRKDGTKIPSLSFSNTAFFGGILIREIEPADGVIESGRIRLDGPQKVVDELYDQFDALYAPDNFPVLVEEEHHSEMDIEAIPRHNLLPSKPELSHDQLVAEKVKTILSNYYGNGSELSESDVQTLEKDFETYRQAPYRFRVKQ